MGILSDFFIAETGTVPEYDGGHDFPANSRVQIGSITPLEAAGIMEVVTGRDTFEVMGEFTLLTPQDAEEWTMSVPDELVKSLARLDDSQMPEIADRCSKLTAEELGWSPNDFLGVISELRQLARLAVDKNYSMFLWNSL